MSTALELAGFSALVAGIYLLLGLPAGLIAAGIILVILGYATDGISISLPSLRRPKPEPKKKKPLPDALTNAELLALHRAHEPT